MVSSRGLSALVCAAVGVGCALSAVGGRRGDEGAVVRIAAAPAPKPAPLPAPGAAAEPPAPPPAAVDTDLPTGSIAPGSALHVPNPLAYRGAAKAGDPVTVAGAEAINYLTGNTLRFGSPGAPARLAAFASRGVAAEGDERGFTARRWDRGRPELCGPGPDGAALCRSVSILLDGKFEYPGARLGTVTLGAAGGSGPVTAELVKGDALRIPEHIPLLDGALGSPDEAAPAPKDPLGALAGRAAAVAADGARGRPVVFYARDGRLLELQPVQQGAAAAVQVAVGRWRAAKAGLCQTRGGAAPLCYRAEPAPGGLRLVPLGKGGEAETLALLPEIGTRDLAQN